MWWVVGIRLPFFGCGRKRITLGVMFSQWVLQAERDPVSGTYVCLCVWGGVRACTCLCTCECAHLPPTGDAAWSLSTHAYTCERVCRCIYTHTYVRSSTCAYICACTYACVCTHTYVCTALLQGNGMSSQMARLSSSGFFSSDEDRPLCRALQPAVEHQCRPLLVQSEPGSDPHV